MAIKKIVSFPRMGEYEDIFKEALEDLGLEVMLPPKTSEKTIKFGCKHSSDMICYPYKVTLGNFWEALENGANTLVMWDSKGQCRFRHYHTLQEYTLKNLGYKFDMYPVNINFIFSLKKINPKLSTFKILKAIRKTFRKIKEIDKRNIFVKGGINIGIIGEIYTCLEPGINYDLINKIKKYGVNAYNTVTIYDFLKESIKGALKLNLIGKRKYKKEAMKYLNGPLGGHGFENIYNLLWLIDNKIDGVIHLLPLSCFTENAQITVDDYTQKPIKDIMIGDKVFTHKGRFRKVINTFSRKYNGNILNIDCGGLLKFDITPEHPILALKRKIKNHKRIIDNPEFIKARELNKGDFIAIPKSKSIIKKLYHKSDMNNKKKPKYKDITKLFYNKDILRLMGYYLAEGSITYDRHKKKNRKYFASVRFTLNKKEKNFIQDIINIVNNNFDAYCKVYENSKRPNVSDLSITNRSFAYLLYKLCGKYCDKKTIHKDIMGLKPELQLELAKGFFRGDGNLRDKYGETTYRAVTTSSKLANQLFWILIRNNIKCALSEQNIKNRKKSYMIKISNAKGIKRLNDNTIKITNRIDNIRFLEIDDYFLTPIKKIKIIKFSGKVYNFEVEEDNSYIANNLAVHNCMPETTVESIIDNICQKNKIPLLRLPIDETNSEANVNTRLETFIELVKRRKK